MFDNVIKHRKIRYDENGQDYAFSRKLDDRLHGREYELAIHVVSPFHENAESEQVLRMQSMGRDELLVIMPSDERLVRDLLMYKRTEKYIRQNISITQQDVVKRILNDKAHQNEERLADIRQRVKLLLSKAKLIVAGGDVEIASEDAQSRIMKGFFELISRTYPNLRMLRGVDFKEDMIRTILEDKNGTLLGTDATSLAESEQEVLAFIQSNSRGGVRTTLKSLLEKFERKPYGWYFAAILCTLANLCARGKVEVRTDGNLLEDAELERALLNTHGHSNVVLEPQVEFTASQVRVLKQFYEDFFDAPPSAGEAKALGKETAAAFQDLINDLTPLAAQVTQYPFLTALSAVIETLKEATGKPYTWYLTEIARQEDSLLDTKEGVIDPIRKFMGGSQKEIFDSVRSFVQSQETNFTYVADDRTQELATVLTDMQCHKGNRMQQVKTLLDEVKGQVDAAVNQVRTNALETLGTMQARMQALDEYQKLPEPRREELDQPFKDLEQEVGRQHLIAVINDRLRYFEDTGYQKLLARMIEMSTPQPSPNGGDEGKGESGKVKEPRVEYVHSRQVKVAYDKAWLADETDVDQYLDSLREALMEEVRKGKRVQI